MKILHIADTHLGYSAYRKTTEEGINQREIDTYNVFKQFINYALKIKPDLLLHAGDLFDSVRPTNRAITFAIRQILRLSKQKIPFVVIAGNHEHPKLKETGHIFSIFDHIEYVYPIYKEKYETLDFTVDKKKVTIHAIPQCQTKEDYTKNLKKLQTNKTSDYNIFMSHGCVTGIKEFKMNEFNELIIPTNYLKTEFDYIALGHYHKYTKIAKNAYYSGATESFTFSDAGEQKGFIELSGEKLKPIFIKVNYREMVDLNQINCKNKTLNEITKTIKQEIIQLNPSGKIFRIKLENIPSHIYRAIDFSEIRKISKDAIHYEIKANITRDGTTKTNESSKIDALTIEYKQFLNDQKIKEKETLLKQGTYYIEKIISQKEGK